MDSITFTCEVITPMFLAGADGQTPELRPASVKGVLRFWWRAMNGNLNLDELKQRESEIFGGSGEGQGKSKVLIRAWLKDSRDVKYFNFEKNGNNFSKGLKYLHYTFYNHYPEREGFDVGTQFIVKMSSSDQNLLIDSAKTFGVLSILGGLGTRVRRGAGAFRIVGIEPKGINMRQTPFYYEKDDGFGRANFIKFLENTNLIENPTQKLSYSNISRAQVSYKKVDGSWVSVLSYIGAIMQQVREKKDDGSPFRLRDLNQKAAFGLPLNVRNERNTVNLFIPNDNGILEEKRRASPIFITVNKILNSHYLTVTKLNGEFMPPNAKIQFKNDLNWSYKEQDSELVDTFWDTITDELENFKTITIE